MQAAATLLAMSRQTFGGRLSTSGSRSEGARQQAQSIAAGLHSAEVSVERAQTIAGIPRMTWEGGGRLAEENDGSSSAAQKSTLGITEHKDHEAVLGCKKHKSNLPLLVIRGSSPTGCLCLQGI